jgi:hypothetical protein
MLCYQDSCHLWNALAYIQSTKLPKWETNSFKDWVGSGVALQGAML